MGKYDGGRNRLAEHVVQAAERLLGQGFSAPEVARRLRIHASTVLKIARGAHGGGRPKFIRCPGCGGLVEPPCVLCDVRAVTPQKPRAA